MLRTLSRRHWAVAVGCLLASACGGASLFAQDSGPLKVCMLSGCTTYDSDTSLAEFQKYLESNYNVTCTMVKRKAVDDLPGLDALEKCDVALIFIRRMELKDDQLAAFKKYCESGKPIVGVRSAGHAMETWPEMDKDVWGGNYQGKGQTGPITEVSLVKAQAKHPILAGVMPFTSAAPLYKHTPLPKEDVVLLEGKIPDQTEPIAWTRDHKNGRVFYTSLGDQADFKQDSFKKMLTNSLFWAAKKEVAPKSASATTSAK